MAESRQSDALVEKRVVEGIADKKFLWIRSSDGDVLSFNRKTGKSTVLAEKSIIDIFRHQNAIYGLAVPEEGSTYQLINLDDPREKFPSIEVDSFAVTGFSDEYIFVIGKDTLFRLNRDKWEAQKLSAPLRFAPQISVDSTKNGMIYVGYNRGEWGGGLQSINPKTGVVMDIERVDGDDCSGPLGANCDPVTGVKRDPRKPNCILASVGLSHFFAKGRVLRICGSTVRVLFEESIYADSDDESKKSWPSTWPFFGLAIDGINWVAVTKGYLFKNGFRKVRKSELPKFEQWNGLGLAVISDDLIALQTDMNWGMSLSGRTPLLIEVHK